MTKPVRPKMKRPVAVSQLLATLFSGTPAENRLKEGAIWEVWNSAVGAQIASRAKPVAIRSGVLTIVVSSPPWLQQLNFMKSQIREKLNEAIGEELVKDIFLKAGTLRNDPDAAVKKPLPPKKPRPLTPEELETVAKATEELTDQELRKTLAALYTLHLSNQKD
ncbi:DUF721 domain-containing protein [Geoanaerobacter pelophilus]